MKYIKKYEERFITDETTPEYYTQMLSIKEKEIFMYWYNIIKPCIDKYDINCANEKLLEWEKEELIKFDMYTLLNRNKKVIEQMKKLNISFQEAKDIINKTNKYNI